MSAQTETVGLRIMRSLSVPSPCPYCDERNGPCRRIVPIHRYRRLLKTRLSDLERQFIERRLSEESSALEALTTETFPIAFTKLQRQCSPATAGAAS